MQLSKRHPPGNTMAANHPESEERAVAGRKYRKVPKELRQRLVSMVQNGAQIKTTARQLNINYENAKYLCRTESIRLEGRNAEQNEFA